MIFLNSLLPSRVSSVFGGRKPEWLQIFRRIFHRISANRRMFTEFLQNFHRNSTNRRFSAEFSQNFRKPQNGYRISAEFLLRSEPSPWAKKTTKWIFHSVNSTFYQNFHQLKNQSNFPWFECTSKITNFRN